MKVNCTTAVCLIALSAFLSDAVAQEGSSVHGLVGLRPLPRTARMDHGHNHGGSWAGTPTFEEQKLNTFPHGDGRGRPVGPETDPHSILGFTKWVIQEIKVSPEEMQ